MHHGTCVTHVSWCMSGSLTRGGEETFRTFPAYVQPAIYVSGKNSMARLTFMMKGTSMITKQTSLYVNVAPSLTILIPLCKAGGKHCAQKYKTRYIMSSVCIRCNIFSHLSFFNVCGCMFAAILKKYNATHSVIYPSPIYIRKAKIMRLESLSLEMRECVVFVTSAVMSADITLNKNVNKFPACSNQKAFTEKVRRKSFHLVWAEAITLTMLITSKHSFCGPSWYNAIQRYHGTVTDIEAAKTN